MSDELPSWVTPEPAAPEFSGWAWRHRLCGSLNDGAWRQGDYCVCGLVVAGGEAVEPYRLVAVALYG